MVDKLHFVESSHTYYYDDTEVPSVTQIIKAAGESTDYSGIPKHILKRAAEIGNRVHETVESFWMEFGPLFCEDDSANAYLRGYASFLEEVDYAHTVSEQRLFCTCHRYAGTVDKIGLINDTPAIIDIKTTSQLNENKVELQTAAYRHLAEHIHDREIPKRYALQLKKNGDYVLYDCDSPLSWPKFERMVDEYYVS